MPKYFIFLLTITVVLLFAVQAETALGQTSLPDIPGVATPSAGDHIFVYLTYFYSLGIFFGGFIALVLLVKAGLQYLTSTGRPNKLKDARQQIMASFLALLIIFGSYMILNTINPQLLRFHLDDVDPYVPPDPIPITDDRPPVMFTELPVGTLITSEIGVSSFVASSTVEELDPDTEIDGYGGFFHPEIGTYPTHYQGGLHGRRLKRVHEVASTTLPVADRLEMLSKALVDPLNILFTYVNELYTLAAACNCSQCPDCPACHDDYQPGACADITCPLCEGDPCPDRDRMEELRNDIIPELIADLEAELPCRMVILDYFASAFHPYLDGHEQLVCMDENHPDFNAHRNSSYCHEGEGLSSGDHVDELRDQIETCIANGHIEQEEYDTDDPDHPFAVEQLIEMMAEVENKGTYTPTTTPPERDLETNIIHLEDNLVMLQEVKIMLTPEYPIACYPQAYSFKQRFQLADAVNIEIEADPLGEVHVQEDPATFYCPQVTVGDPSETLLLEGVPKELACKPIIEIPVGNAIDEAIRLMVDILTELGDPNHIDRRKWDPNLSGRQGIWNSGHEMIEHALKQNELASSTIALSEEIVELTHPDYCLERCQDVPCRARCHQMVTNIYDNGNKIGEETEYICEIPCEGPDVCTTMDDIREKRNEAHGNVAQANMLLYDIKNLKIRIYESFFKLNSEYPEKIPHQGEWMAPEDTDLDQGLDEDWEAEERAPIGEDLCCQDPENDCRDPNNFQEFIFADHKMVEIDYTLREKLIFLQKLLNRARNFRDYRILIDELVAMDLDWDDTVIEEYTNIPPDSKQDLSSCDSLVMHLDLPLTEGTSRQILENCFMAKNFGHASPRLRTFDAPYYCEYWDPLIPPEDRKSRLLGYCFGEIHYPDIANNFFCCHLEY